MRSLALILCLLTLTPRRMRKSEWETGETTSGRRPKTVVFRWNGFVEAAFGSRWDRDPQVGRKQTLGDARVRLETEWSGERLTVGFKGEAWYDSYFEGVRW